MSSIVDMSRCISPPPKKNSPRFPPQGKRFWWFTDKYLSMNYARCCRFITDFVLFKIFWILFFFFILFQTDIGFLSRSFCLNANLRKELSFTSILPIYRNVVKEEWYYVIWLSEIWKQYIIYYVDQIVFKT